MAASGRESRSADNGKVFPKTRHSSSTYGGRRDSVRRPKNDPRSPPPKYLRERALQQQQLLTPAHTPSSSVSSLALVGEHANGITMERTNSGNSILSDKPYDQQYENTNTLTYRDRDAAERVESHFRQEPSQWKSGRAKHERILRRLIKRGHPLDPGFIDDEALEGIITAADTIFFGGVLCGRVRCDWSSEKRYQTELIGSTALRQRPDGSIETLIVLSEPILRDPQYDRRLLLSAFFHELVHCYLFIMCGFEARIEGGHTPGFHSIARIIDTWVGNGYLGLCDLKANLNHFRRPTVDPTIDHRHKARCNRSPAYHRMDEDYL